MQCLKCSSLCSKWGSINGKQRYRCRKCGVTQCLAYYYNACKPNVDQQIVGLMKESCGIRSISRLLHISPVTVLKRILRIAETIKKPSIAFGRIYEADELKTYVKRKDNEQWVIYAIDRHSKKVVDFRVGRRTKKNIEVVINTLLISAANRIYTDGLTTYKSLIPQQLHTVKAYNINRIERTNLSLRTHLKRLSRKTICYSKCAAVLTACLKIYFWF